MNRNEFPYPIVFYLKGKKLIYIQQIIICRKMIRQRKDKTNYLRSLYYYKKKKYAARM